MHVLQNYIKVVALFVSFYFALSISLISAGKFVRVHVVCASFKKGWFGLILEVLQREDLRQVIGWVTRMCVSLQTSFTVSQGKKSSISSTNDDFYENSLTFP